MDTFLWTFLNAYAKTWDMCLAMFLFFVVVGLVARFMPVGRLDTAISPRPVLYGCLSIWFFLLSVCLTLIDFPHFNLTPEMKDWLFMFSAFLGIPVSVPFLAGAVWAAAYQLNNAPVRLLPLALIMLGSFALACAASNIHDVAWCGVITNGYTGHYAAGYDLDFFVAFGEWFGIARETTADYATLGPCAFVMVIGELITALCCFKRLSALRQVRREHD